MKLDERNWSEIQKYYNDNHTWNDIILKFKLSTGLLNKAKKENRFISRSKSQSNKIFNKGRFHSEETKKKISLSRIKFLEENPDKVPYLLNHYSKGESYAENYFDKILSETLKYERYYQVNQYQLDFAFVEKMIDLEIDGDQHYLDNRIIESDKRRNKKLNKLGWKILRIKWSDYKKLEKIQKEEVIKNLIKYLENNSDIPPEIPRKEKKIYLCKCGKEMFRTSKMCVDCKSFKDRKVKDRPTKEILNEDVKMFGYVKTGKKYGVSDNTIRKWLK